jgi:phospholipid-translocating ATPase
MVAHKKSRIPQLLSKINPEVLFGRKQRPREPRTVYFNQPLPQEYYDHKGKVLKNHTYITNQVVTSKYTVFTFVPRNLLEQFRRVANM